MCGGDTCPSSHSLPRLFAPPWCSNFVVRRVFANGTIILVAGNHVSGYSGDHGPATSGKLGCVLCIHFAHTYHFWSALFCCSQPKDTRRLLPRWQWRRLHSRCWLPRCPPGEQAQRTAEFCVLPCASLALASVSQVSAAGIIVTFAGINGNITYYNEGGPATQASLNYPQGVSPDGTGGVLIAGKGDCNFLQFY